MQTLHRLEDTGRTHAARYLSFLLHSGLLFAAGLPVATLAQSAPVERTEPADPIAAYVAEASQRFGIPAASIRAVIRVESAGDARATSRAGAMGLMQIMPATWTTLRSRLPLGNDPYDPRDNILAGAAYLREMLDRYGSPGFLAAYSAGPGRYEAYLAGRPLPAETRAYVATLAPIIGGTDALAPVTVAAADPNAWTRAPLFIAQSERGANPDPVPIDGASKEAPAAIPMRNVTDIAPPSAGLFVTRNGDRGPR